MLDNKLNTVFTFRVDNETADKTEAIARAVSRRRADVVRLLFLKALKKFDAKKDRL